MLTRRAYCALSIVSTSNAANYFSIVNHHFPISALYGFILKLLQLDLIEMQAFILYTIESL
jgi:hypothetical protein